MASRFYFAATTTPTGSITPGFAAWDRTSEGIRRWMGTTKDGSTLAGSTFWAGAAAGANATCLAVQFVSDPLAAGIAFSTSDTIKCVVQGRESAANDNINRSPICVKVYSEDGSTLRATLKGLGHIGPNTTEWVATGLRSKRFADGDTLDANYTTVARDRLVIEIGGQVSGSAGTSVTGTLNIGSSDGTDLPENETQTTAGDPWFEISRTVTFYTPFALSASSNIAASAATSTTARLTAPSGKTSGADFDAGFISDDTNPLPTIDIGDGGYTEVEWCIAGDADLVEDDVYQFRVVESDDTPLDTYTVTPTWTVGTTAFSLVPDAGSFALTGATVGLLAGLVLVPTAGAYAVTGTDVGLLPGYGLAAATTTYEVTGTDVGLRGDFTLVPEAGSYVVTGTDVTLTYGSLTNYSLTLDTTAFDVTGTAVVLVAGYVAVPEAGSYALTGTDVTLTYSGGSAAFTLSASTNIAGSAATATTARLTAPSGKTSGADFQAGFISDDTNPLPTLDLASGKYTELEWCIVADAGLSSGDTYQFRVVESDDTALDTYTVTPTWFVGTNSSLALDAGAFAITGTDVGVLHDSLLTLTAGAYDLTGTDVLVERGSFLTLEAGSYALTGTDITFSQNFALIPTSGTYALTGTTVALTPQSPEGVYTLTGSSVSFTHNIIMSAGSGSFSLTGTDVGAYRGAALAMGAGSYGLTGSAVTLVYDMVGSYTLIVEPEAYVLTGTDVALRGQHPLTIETGSFTLTGTAVGLTAQRLLTLDAGTATLTGSVVTLTKTSDTDIVFVVDGAEFLLTGRPISMRYGNTPPEGRPRWNRHPRCHPIIGRRR